MIVMHARRDGAGSAGAVIDGAPATAGLRSVAENKR